jgi:hypothetical protein
VLDERFEDAAGIFGGMGTRPHEAMARLRAGEQMMNLGRHADARAHLAEALAFFRSVRATRYLEEAEALLATTAAR